MQRWKKLAIGVLGAFVVLVLAGYLVYGGGEVEGRGRVHETAWSSAAVEARSAAQTSARGEGHGGKQILFGDLHVHTTFSTDAFIISLPLLAGEGAHPPADACDFARFCSALDFFAITDHAEALTPRRWQETKESIRECNAVADPKTPDLVAFTGFEWTQVGRTPEEHFGHKNVIFRETADADLPTRPIAAPGLSAQAFRDGQKAIGVGRLLSIPILDFANRQRYKDLTVYQRETFGVTPCPEGVAVQQLPPSCREFAATPEVLFDKLTQWGHESLVIPHGTTWGFYTPPGYRYDKGLEGPNHDPERQRLVEIYSGHGNSEQYRSWSASERGDDGALRCPAPTDDYEPCCHRAGELIRERCGEASPEECERRVAAARLAYLEAGVAGHLTVPGASVEDWKDCGQCRDCFLPAFSYRPGGAAQYMLARGDFTGKEPRHAELGFIASSDNHKARPGTGYKEYARRRMTEATGGRTLEWHRRIFGEPGPKTSESVPLSDERRRGTPPFLLLHAERQSSFFLTGGLVAVHSEGRSRDAIWEALKRREVYGTSGPRILLWFDLENGPAGRASMGADVKLAEPPRFSIRAAGAFVQKPGCPDGVTRAGMTAERLEHLCAGECYNPGDERRRITRIEVVRIRRQRRPDEPIAPLIEDVYRRLDCPERAAVCEVGFEDADFVEQSRDTVYYVRAIQEPTAAVNAASLRCERDAKGNCLAAKPCYGDARTPLDEDCLADTEERAWSSPIYVRFDSAAAPRAGEASKDDEEQQHD